MFLKIFIIRAISRSFEIMIAFYDDVVDDEPKKTDLKPGRRISLVTKSHFEIIINFTIVYQLLNLCDKKDTGISNLLFSIGISTFTDVKFNYCKDYNLCNLLICIQLFTSLSLVSFALAKYIGGIKQK